MSVDFRKLKSFVKIVDTGSMSRAASILRTAQPALSQQIASLEAHFNHKLLIRSNVGIAPTEAGLILYRHAQLMLKQIEQAQIDINQSATSVAGRVSIGLATYSSSSALSLPLLKEMKVQHPRIVVHINDSFGHILSELIMTGKMDMALIYSADPMKGVTLQPLFREEMFLVSPPGLELPGEAGEPLPLSDSEWRSAPAAEQEPSAPPPDRRGSVTGAGHARGCVRDRVRSGPQRRGAGRLGVDHSACLGGDRDRKLRRCPGQTDSCGPSSRPPCPCARPIISRSPSQPWRRDRSCLPRSKG